MVSSRWRLFPGSRVGDSVKHGWAFSILCGGIGRPSAKNGRGRGELQQEVPMTLFLYNQNAYWSPRGFRSQWKQAMLEDPSQGAGANHEKTMDATAIVPGEDKKPEDITVS